MSKAKGKVWCRECGEEMKQYPYGILAFGCKKCKLKATILFGDMPVLKSKGVAGGIRFR